MKPNDRLTETLRLSVVLEDGKRKAARLSAYLKMSERAYRLFLEWNGKLMRYDIAERRREGWTATMSKITTAHNAERMWRIHQRCMAAYINLVKSL